MDVSLDYDSEANNNHVSGNSAPWNHGYHDAKEDNYGNRAEPMYPGVKNMEIVLPSSCL